MVLGLTAVSIALLAEAAPPAPFRVLYSNDTTRPAVNAVDIAGLVEC